MRRVISVIILLLAVAALAALCGVVFEYNARRITALADPLPGRRVDIGGRALYLDCRGRGAPTVVLEAGLDLGGALAWSAVHERLASRTRTCAYSRAGLIGSDPSPALFSATSVSEDLERLLKVSGETGPWLVVAHSLGAPLALRFVRRNEERVVGLLLLDPSHPDQMARLAAVAPELTSRGAGTLRLLAALREVGATRLLLRMMPARAGQPAAAARLERLHAPPTLDGVLREYAGIASVLDAATRDTALGRVPLRVLSAGRPVPDGVLEGGPEAQVRLRVVTTLWHQLHEEMAGWSSRGAQRVVEEAGHYVHEDAPDVVVESVRELVALQR